MPCLRVGLNPYGISYSVGLTGTGTPRANREPLGMTGFVDLAIRIGATVVSLPAAWIAPLDDGQRRALRDRLRDAAVDLIIDAPVMRDAQASLNLCSQMHVDLMRTTLSGVLEGGRAAHGQAWRDLCDRITPTLHHVARIAKDSGITVAIENHQDFTSHELAAFCEAAGEPVGVCLDVGNALAVGEDCVRFARRVAPHLKMLHLKDYLVQWTNEGYRLVRCAIGDGAVPFADVVASLTAEGATVDAMPALIEPGALEHRHIRLLTDGWWEGYPQRSARDLAAGLAAARRGLLTNSDDWRTPWEAECDSDAIIEYEMQQLNRSVANLKAVGLMA